MIIHAGAFPARPDGNNQLDRKAMPHSTIGFIIINGKSGIE